MRKKHSFILSCIFLLVFSSAALGAEGFYAGFNAGFSYLDDATVSQVGAGNTVEVEYDSGLGFSGVVGYDFGTPRVEGEIAYLKNDIDKLSTQGTTVSGSGDATTWSFMLNGYVDIENRSAFTPYFGGGIGLASVSMENIIISNFNLGSESDTAFAYNFAAGIAWEIKEPITLDLRYRYFATTNPELGSYEAEYAASMVILGIRYTFK
jgi:opacity protein-like surface antigen